MNPVVVNETTSTNSTIQLTPCGLSGGLCLKMFLDIGVLFNDAGFLGKSKQKCASNVCEIQPVRGQSNEHCMDLVRFIIES